ncbi:MAG: NDP-hexose 2,3-dehydratase family protein [Candidatus Cloacimonas sp.]|jgi:oxidase EvaA|nr:NDP-hexose 2,3-dehydratase family protein [Candidatus Cloacimonas sp.]
MMLKERVLGLKAKLSKVFGDYSKQIEFELLFSALIDYNPLNSTDDLLVWLKTLNDKQYFHVEEIPFSQLKQWHFEKGTGDLRHNSGKFFSIRGYQVFDSSAENILWDQPIIDQPEIGVLGILCKQIDGILYFLMQAKAEPGNINTYQISPTVQATRSNYLQVHGGRRTKYLEYFNGEMPITVILDQYQSEQGARFMGKRNRNIMVIDRTDKQIKIGENHRWLTLGQLKSLMELDNTVNMDSRSIISQIRYLSLDFELDVKTLLLILHEYKDIVSKSDFWLKSVLQTFANAKLKHNLSTIRNHLTWERYFCTVDKKPVPLNEIKDWSIGEKVIEHKAGKYFQVLAVRIIANNREIDSWDQPIIRQRHDGMIGVLCAEIEGVLHFLIRMKLEPGLYDRIELAPTVQCIQQNYDSTDYPKYLECFNNAPQTYNAKQSEEGGRFYRECSSNMIQMIEYNKIDISPGYMWLSLKQLKEMVQYQQLLNVELRSLLAYF